MAFSTLQKTYGRFWTNVVHNARPGIVKTPFWGYIFSEKWIKNVLSCAVLETRKCSLIFWQLKVTQYLANAINVFAFNSSPSVYLYNSA